MLNDLWSIGKPCEHFGRATSKAPKLTSGIIRCSGNSRIICHDPKRVDGHYSGQDLATKIRGLTKFDLFDGDYKERAQILLPWAVSQTTALSETARCSRNITLCEVSCLLRAWSEASLQPDRCFFEVWPVTAASIDCHHETLSIIEIPYPSAAASSASSLKLMPSPPSSGLFLKLSLLPNSWFSHQMTVTTLCWFGLFPSLWLPSPVTSQALLSGP
jgi:hypothetical protein